MSYPFLDAPSHEQLDQELIELHQRLIGTASHASINALARTIIEGVAGKLLRPGWKAEWREHQAISWGWFGDIGRNREARALYAVFAEMVRYTEEGATPALQRQYQQQLLEALDGYFAWRGLDTGQGVNGSDPFADFPSKQRKLLDALWRRGEVSIPDLQQAVYDDGSCDDGEPLDPETLRKLVGRTNDRLSEKRPSVQIKKIRNGGYALEDV